MDTQYANFWFDWRRRAVRNDPRVNESHVVCELHLPEVWLKYPDAQVRGVSNWIVIQ